MAGKGDKPRNCFTSQFKSNYDKITWKTKLNNNVQKKQKGGKKTYVYSNPR